MPAAKAALPSELINRLRENIAQGKASRETLGLKLAELSPREISKLPRSVLTRIGPEGVATMARVAAGTDDALPAPRRASVRIQSRESTSGPPPLWLVCSAASLLVIALTILAGTIDRPLRWGLFRSGYQSGDAMGLCNRLDRWTEDCSYIVTAPSLGLADIEARLARHQNSFSIPHTILHADGSLPLGTVIHVNRNSER
ncbi:hypothetical protein [Afipia birgiae]|uniref:hypothetical protein n=1 Tax=Afipia birgiae TaxID=151414 RepID=UPI00030B9694|nr:hypothetical protein [Afipia birgiae]